MNTLFKLRNALIFALAGLAALFIAVGCGGDDGDEGGGFPFSRQVLLMPTS